jgi:hypothetical protein
MSKYQLVGTGWSVGAVFIPVGSIINTDTGTDDYSNLIRSKGLNPPISAMALDQPTFDLMRSLYSGPVDQGNPALWVKQDYVRYVLTGPGVVR